MMKWHRNIPIAVSLIMAAWLTFVSADQFPLTYRLAEELPAGTFVGNVKNDSALVGRHTPEVAALLEFSLQHSTGVYALFKLDKKSGILTTTRPIDREVIDPDTSIELSVRVTPARYFAIIKMVIHIVDINDNAPHFPEPQVALAVSELTRPGALFTLPTAEDADGPRFNVQSYELHGEEIGIAPEKFGLKLVNHSGTSLDVKLLLQQELDYEIQSSYSLMLVALDGGSPPLSGTLQIQITLTDANDNSPYFVQSEYSTSISENTKVGTTLALVAAIDEDAGLNGKVTYFIDPNTNVKDMSLFRMNNTTGALILAKTLDYETSRTHSLTVVAQDQGVQPFSAFARVLVHVEDVNDNAPIVTFHTLSADDTADDSEKNTVEVMENLPSGTFVAQLTVMDVDSGQSGAIECYIDNENEKRFSLQRLTNGIEYRIVTSAQFDRESRDSYRVKTVCSDNGQPRLTSTGTLTVMIGDVNDHDPFFLRQVYHVHLLENNEVGDAIIRLNASDQDTGSNALLTYSISQVRRNQQALPDQSLVSIEPKTGLVKASVKFNFETADEEGYLFQVVVVDSGKPVRSALTLLNITIEDQNDEYPVFTEERYVFLIMENVPPPAELGVVSASDADGPRHNQILYSIPQFDDKIRKFAIDTYTGRLVTIRPLDREEVSVHNFLVQASNPGLKNVATYANVSVVVLDENDNAPDFKSHTPGNNTVNIRNDVPVGFVVTRLVAVDPDVGNGGLVSYSIVSGNEEGNFVVDPISGEVTTTRFLSRYINNLLKLTVSAQDADSSPKSTRVSLFIHVTQQATVAAKSFDSQTGAIAGLPHQLTFGIVIVIGALGALLVIAISAIVIAVLCLSNRRQRQRRKDEIEAKKLAEEAAALVLKADEERAKQAAITSAATGLLWNSSCPSGDDDTMDILRVSCYGYTLLKIKIMYYV